MDDKDNPIKWTTSVRMLSEGWDAKNVFQIVPHGEPAFNSKLLITQFLRRDLWVTEVYRDNQPVVTVFNHDKCSSSIKHLADEVLETEKRIHPYPMAKEEDYNFDLYKIDYGSNEKKLVRWEIDSQPETSCGYDSKSKMLEVRHVSMSAPT